MLAKHVVPKGSAVDVINRYLKTIVVTKVRVSDFKPSTTTVEPDGVAAVAEEFRGFLAANFGKSKGKDVIEVLQLE